MNIYLLLWRTVLDMKGFVVGFRFVGLVYKFERYVCLMRIVYYVTYYKEDGSLRMKSKNEPGFMSVRFIYISTYLSTSVCLSKYE